MIARAKILLPFSFTLPDDEQYLKYNYKLENYLVTIYPPSCKTDKKNPVPNGITIDGKSSYQADLLVIDFQKEEFNRSNEIESDPPIELIEIIANDFLNRLRWKSSLLDAEAILPEIGPSIVLTFTALEVFIAKTLDLMAEYNKVDLELWTLINKHESRNLKIENRFKFLSKYFIGASIADDPKLWKAFGDLQKARNSFAHKGIAKIQEEIVNVDKARELIINANNIISYLRGRLPADLQQREYNHMIKIEGVFPLDLANGKSALP